MMPTNLDARSRRERTAIHVLAYAALTAVSAACASQIEDDGPRGEGAAGRASGAGAASAAGGWGGGSGSGGALAAVGGSFSPVPPVVHAGGGAFSGGASNSGSAGRESPSGTAGTSGFGGANAPMTAGSGGTNGGRAGASNGGRAGAADGGRAGAADGGRPAGAAGSTGVAGSPAEPTGRMPPVPAPNGACPTLESGAATILGTTVQLTVGSKPGPLYLYWHATGQSYTEVARGLPGATDAVARDGGIVASFDDTNGKGTNTGNGVWYTGDFEAADQIVACGVAAGLVDTTRIYTAGYSAGGLQACAMAASHGAYLAAAICYSGGAATVSGTPRGSDNLPPTLLLHGAAGQDTFILDFNRASATWAAAYTRAGGFAIDCDDGGDHIASASRRMGFDGRAMKFLADHPYGVQPEPYAAALPADWPDYCNIVK